MKKKLLLLFFLMTLSSVGIRASKWNYYDLVDGAYEYIGDAAISDSYYPSATTRYLYGAECLHKLTPNSIHIYVGGSFITSKMEIDKPSHKKTPIVLWTPTGNVRWEKSVDNGVTWQYIVNTNPYYEEKNSERGTALYRTLDPDGTYSNIVTIHYYDEIPETIAVLPDNVTKSVEESVTFTADVEDDGYTYQWKLNWKDIEGATSREYTIESIRAKDAGTYTCVVTNPVGTVTTLPATLAVNRISQTITFPDIEAKTFGDPDFLLPEFTDKNLPIVYSSSNPKVATVSGNTVHIVAPGETIITANQSGSDDYLEAAYVSRKLVVNKRKQTIDFSIPEKKKYGDLPFLLPETTDEGLPISYKVINTKVASVTGNTVTILNAGQTEIIASQAGDATRYEATPVTQTLIVDKANQTINFGAIGGKVYGDPSITLNEVTDAALPITYTVEGEAVKIENGNTLTIVRPGTAVVTASQAGSENYNSAQSVSQTVTVSKAAQTIHWDNIPNLTYGDADVVLPMTSDKNLLISYSSSNQEVAEVEGNILKIMGAGHAEITAHQEGNEFYNEAASITLPVNVAKAYQTITFPEIPELTFGMGAFTLGAATDSSAEIQYESSNNNVVKVEGNILTVTGAGSCHVTATANGDNNFYDATPVSREITVKKASQTVSFEELEDLTYGMAPFTLTASSSTGKAMTFKSSDSKIISINGSLATIRGAGTAILTAIQEGDANYNPESVSITVRVNKASLIARADDITRVYGDENPKLTVTYSGFVNGDGEGELAQLPTVETPANILSNVGSYPLNVSSNEDKNYQIIPQKGILTVEKSPLLVIANNTSRLYGGQNPEFTYTLKGFKNNDSERDLLGTPSLYTDAKTGSRVGSYIITPEGGDARNYVLNYQEGTLTIEKAPLTATLGDLEREYGVEKDPIIVIDGYRLNDSESSIAEIPQVINEADILSDTGEYKMTLTGGLAENYYFTFRYSDNLDHAKLNITKAPLTIKADDKEISVEDPIPTLTMCYTGFRNDDSADDLDEWPHIEVVDFERREGEFKIELSGGKDKNYEYILIPGILKLNGYSAIANISNNGTLKVYKSNGTVYVTGFERYEDVVVYSSAGTKILPENISEEVISFTPENRGFYIITDGKSVVKVVI